MHDKIIKGLFQYDYSQRTRRYRVSSFMSSHIGFRPLIYIKGHFCRSKLSQTSLIVIHFILFLPRVLLAGENALHEIVEVSSLVFITLCQRSGQFRDLTFISQWAKIQIVPIEWLCVRTRGGRRYQIFETATATSATLADWNRYHY